LTDLVVLSNDPPRELLFKRRVSVFRGFRDVWRNREILRAMSERQIRARYKQALLGFLWVIITPLALMVAFTLVFQKVAKVDTEGVPYALFSYMGLLPWSFFNSSISTGATSMVTNVPLLNKIACPREIFPLSCVADATVDSFMAGIALGALFLVNGFMPKATSYWALLALPVQVIFTIGLTLLLSALVVYIRDLRHGMPLMLQLGLLVTPVAYGFNIIPRDFRWLYSLVNPLGPVIDTYRRSILMGKAPRFEYLGLGAAGAVLLLVISYWAFKRMETGLADVA
jgi:ABC-type polysaccharide/polyol phosphate export permease